MTTSTYKKSSSSPARRRVISTSTGGTYADYMATQHKSQAPPSPTPTVPRNCPLESSTYVMIDMPNLTTVEAFEPPSSAPSVKLPSTKSEPVSDSWADVMEDTPITSPPPSSSPPSISPAPSSPSKPQPKRLQSMHAPSSHTLSRKKSPPKTQNESVLVPPTEKRVPGKYGNWSNLKGDPEKLARLNDPNAKPLESRWAC